MEEENKVQIVTEESESSMKAHSEKSDKAKTHSHSHKKKTSSSNKKASESGKGIVDFFLANTWRSIAIVLALLLFFMGIGGYISIDIGMAGNAAGGSGAVDDSAAAEIDLSAFYEESDPVLGDADAPVTIVEFSDFECPFCARAYSDAFTQIKNTYVANGDVKIVFRDFPLSFHAQATPAALAGECAHEQGMFWEYHDLLFENQHALSSENYIVWARQLGLDEAQFTSCFESQKYFNEVSKDFSDGGALGVQGTPAFFVNGQLVSGAQPFSVFQQIIEAELN